MLTCRGGEGGHPCSLWPDSPAADDERGGETPCVYCARAVGEIVCPRCEGQRYDRGSCGLCGNLGLLDANGDRITFAQEALIADRLLDAGALAAHAADCDCGRHNWPERTSGA